MTDSPGEKPKASKEFQKVSFNAFLDAKAQLGCTDAELCEAIGYNRNAWTNWLAAGEMPKVASIACEAIVRRKGVDPTTPTYHVVMTFDRGKPVRFTRLAQLKELMLDGKKYLLVPASTVEEL